MEHRDPSVELEWVEAHRVELLLRAALTRLATADEAAFDAGLDAVDQCLAEFERLRTRSGPGISWPPDAEARLSVSRLEIRRLRGGKVRRTEAISKVRLLLPRFGRIGHSQGSGEETSKSG